MTLNLVDLAGERVRGTWDVRECVKEQPWLPNGPVPLQVSWIAPGYRRKSTLTSGKDPVA